MNKLIEQFAEQVDLMGDCVPRRPPFKGYIGRIQVEALEQFAQLIVEACAEVCTDEYHTRDGFGITNADQRCHDLILKTFGVE